MVDKTVFSSPVFKDLGRGLKHMKKIMKYGDIDRRILEEIIKSIQQINYGEVVITIHDSKTVQIEKKEKKRFY